MYPDISDVPLQKYVRLKTNEFIIFSRSIEHKEFASFEPVTAGFCKVWLEMSIVLCYGKSTTLDLPAEEDEDTRLATIQFFGDGSYKPNI